jgi:hypothetical protein
MKKRKDFFNSSREQSTDFSTARRVFHSAAGRGGRRLSSLLLIFSFLFYFFSLLNYTYPVLNLYWQLPFLPGPAGCRSGSKTQIAYEKFKNRFGFVHAFFTKLA